MADSSQSVLDNCRDASEESSADYDSTSSTSSTRVSESSYYSTSSGHSGESHHPHAPELHCEHGTRYQSLLKDDKWMVEVTVETVKVHRKSSPSSQADRSAKATQTSPAARRTPRRSNPTSCNSVLAQSRDKRTQNLEGYETDFSSLSDDQTNVDRNSHTPEHKERHNKLDHVRIRSGTTNEDSRAQENTGGGEQFNTARNGQKIRKTDTSIPKTSEVAPIGVVAFPTPVSNDNTFVHNTRDPQPETSPDAAGHLKGLSVSDTEIPPSVFNSPHNETFPKVSKLPDDGRPLRNGKSSDRESPPRVLNFDSDHDIRTSTPMKKNGTHIEELKRRVNCSPTHPRRTQSDTVLYRCRPKVEVNNGLCESTVTQPLTTQNDVAQPPIGSSGVCNPPEIGSSNVFEFEDRSTFTSGELQCAIDVSQPGLGHGKSSVKTHDHHSEIRFDFIVNGVPASLNLNLMTRVDSPTLELDPTELDVNGEKIWRHSARIAAIRRKRALRP